MTVAELIQALSDLPPETEVVVVHSEWPIKKIIYDYDQIKECKIVKVQ